MNTPFQKHHFFANIRALKMLTFTTIILASGASAQTKVKDSINVNKLDEVLVSSVRVNSKTPVSFSNLDKEAIQSRNLGQDIPILMNFMPSVVTTSDAGNGMGYTGIRVRGTDATRVNVTINGIPYNDSESSGTYFVNIPDFASSVESLQLQRGVGTSTNGAGAFGASLNLLTDSFSKESSGEISNSFGSFHSRKHTVKFSTGMLNQGFELAGRLSNIDSHGYVDRATSEMKSYFLQGTYVGKTTLIKALAFGGKEKTYQAWYGVDSDKLQHDRTYNYAGIFTDELGNTRFYDNQTDNYQQDHFQLHWNEKIAANWNTNLAVHYTKGKGFYEEYAEDQDFLGYGLLPLASITTTDLVRQKWLDNDFYGTTFSLNYKKQNLDVILGGSWNKYNGDHFGKVIWARYASQSELGDRYYDDKSIKIDGTVFLKANYQITSKLSLYGDLQYRRVSYKANGVQPVFVNDVFKFLNPKAGLNYRLNPKNNLYFSYAKANREPNRTDYENGNPKPEKLNDFELGWRHESSKFQWNANTYYMEYKDQLILTGALDEVGNPIRANTDKSYRLGLEIEAACALSKKISLQGNVTASLNIINTNENSFLHKEPSFFQKWIDFNGQQIAYSPKYVSGAIVTYQPIRSLKMAWLQKYVGKQFLNNQQSEESHLPSYYTNDLNLSYEFNPKRVFKSIVLTALANNVLDKKYVSNGADYGGGYVYYFPQAGINFFVGLTLTF